MAVKTAKFSTLKIGTFFYAEGGNGYDYYKKVSDLEYECVKAPQVFGTFYATPGFTVDLTSKYAAPAPAAKPKKTAKSAPKKAAKK